MFYSQVILAKKGPLSKVWLAAHWGDKKLARPQIFATDISQSCTDIMNPSVPLALRLSGHLLLGVVRIYSRKVKYVLNDCTEAMLKLQMAFTTTKQIGDEKGSSRELLSEKDAPMHQLVSNFGEYDQVHIVEGFCLPLPEDNEWILAEDDDDDDDNEIPQEQHLLVAAVGQEGGRQQGGRQPDHIMASPEEETWAAFDPDEDEDDDDEDNDAKNEERSQVSDIEIVRAANDSMLSEDQTRRSTSMIGDKSAFTEDGTGAAPGSAVRAAAGGENPDDYDFNVPFDDDESEDEQGVGDFTSGDGGLNLDLSRDGGTPGGGGNNSVANMSGLAMDDDDSATQASTTTNKRPHEEKKPRKRRRKRRKVVIDNNATELTTEHIRDMISNTDGIVRTMIHPASIWDEDGLGRDYKTLVKERSAQDGITIINFITTTTTGVNNKKKSSTKIVVPSLTRPFLVDESEMNGGESRLHPDLQKLWQDNYWKALDQPCPFKRRDVATEDEPVDDVERVRRDDGSKADDDSDLGSQQSDLNVEKENQQPQEGGPPLDEDAFNFPTGDDDEEEEEQEEDAPVDFGDDEEEQDLGVVNRSRDENDMLELGMVNDMVLDSDEDDDDGDDDDDLANRQALGDVASSTTKWHKHTVRVFQHLKKCMKDPNQEHEGGDSSAEDADDEPKKDLPEQISFKNLTKNVVSRRNAASVFFEMLQLKTWDFIDLDQEDSYGDITVSPGIRFGESGGGSSN